MTQLAIIIVLIAIIAIYEFRKIRHKFKPPVISKKDPEIHLNAQIETWGFDMEKTEKYTEDSGND